MTPRVAIPLVLVLVIVTIVITVLSLRHESAGGQDGVSDADAKPGDSSLTGSGSTGLVAYGPWHGKSATPTYGGGLRSCATCHWNAGLDFTKAEWTAAATEGGKVTQWNLTITPRYPQVALLGIELDPSQAPTIDERSNAAWAVGSEWSQSIDVPADASALIVQVQAASNLPDTDKAVQDAGNSTGGTANTNGADPHRTRPSLHFTLEGPGGSFASSGPEADRQVVSTPATPGSWTVKAMFDALTVSGQPLQQGTGSMRIEILRGAASAAVAHEHFRANGLLASKPNATFLLPARANGDPPSIDLRVRVYHDHDRFYQLELNDIALMEQSIAPLQGLETLPIYTAAQIDALWGQSTEYTVHDYTVAEAALFTTGADGAIDQYVYGDPYTDVLPSHSGVIAGTTRLRFEATWTPAIPLNDVLVRFKPRNVPHWFDAEPTSNAPGTATFEADVIPEWWDADQRAGDWDMHFSERVAPNRQYAYSVQVHLVMYAVR